MPYPERRSTVRGLLLEAAAVLLGILTAFGLDAGYGLVRERAELRESLSLLRDEFSDARVQLSAVLDVGKTSTRLCVISPGIFSAKRKCPGVRPAQPRTIFSAGVR